MQRHRGKDPILGVVLTRHGREVGDQPEVHEVGTAATLLGAGRYPDGRYDIVVRGGRRFRVEEGDWASGYLTARVTWLAEEADDADVPLAAKVRGASEAFLLALEQITGGEVPRDELGEDPRALAYAVCERLPLNIWERQRLLEDATVAHRLERLLTILRRERALLLKAGAGGAGLEHSGLSFLAN